MVGVRGLGTGGRGACWPGVRVAAGPPARGCEPAPEAGVNGRKRAAAKRVSGKRLSAAPALLAAAVAGAAAAVIRYELLATGRCPG